MKSFIRKRSTTRRRRDEEPSLARHLIRGFVVMCIVVSLFALTWYFTRRPAVTLTTVIVKGGETISHDMVKANVDQVLNGSYLFIIPYRFAYFYPRNRIRDALNTIPRIHDVVVTRTSRNNLDVSFGEYIPDKLWCTSIDDSAPCYFLDATGYAFAPAPALQGGALTRLVIKNKDTLAVGQAMTPDLFLTVDNFLKALEEKLNLRVYQVVYTKVGDIELYLAGGGKLLVTDTMDAHATLNNLQSVLTAKEFAHIKPGNFNYIDLRFGNKVYVNEEMAVATSTASVTSSSTNLGTNTLSQ